METKDIPALIERLRYFNDWRRGADGEQPNPEQIGRDIDAAVAILSRQASAPEIQYYGSEREHGTRTETCGA
mgnify:FL=1